MGLAETSSVLWHERELLELLLFKLEEEQLVLASGRTRWLARATREVETVLSEIRKAEVIRAVEVDALAKTLGLPAGASVAQLAAAAPEVWGGLFTDHRRAFLVLTNEITALAAANRELLAAGQLVNRDVLSSLSDGLETYDSAGASRGGTLGARMIDQAL
jgi:FlgN protein